MVELFNPAGLRILEDRQGAAAYGYVAPRVLYARVVGCLSEELGTSFARELDSVTRPVASLACFVDASALREYDPVAQARLQALVAAERRRFSSIVMLTWASGSGLAWRELAAELGEAVELLSEPLEFERALCNVATFPDRTAKDWGHVWQLHAPR
jgi:hypothetical protein